MLLTHLFSRFAMLESREIPFCGAALILNFSAPVGLCVQKTKSLAFSAAACRNILPRRRKLSSPCISRGWWRAAYHRLRRRCANERRRRQSIYRLRTLLGPFDSGALRG